MSGVGPDWFEVSLIPTTLALTTLGSKGVGDPVNLEVDILAKHVEKLLQTAVPRSALPLRASTTGTSPGTTPTGGLT